MKDHRRLLFALTAITLLLVVTCASVLTWLIRDGLERATARDLAANARQHLRLGMSRAEVELQMSSAWRRYDCRDSNEIVYLFGSRNERVASTLYLRYQLRGGQDVLETVGTVDDQLHSFRKCAVYTSP
jgi:hypothetical protein